MWDEISRTLKLASAELHRVSENASEADKEKVRGMVRVLFKLTDQAVEAANPPAPLPLPDGWPLGSTASGDER